MARQMKDSGIEWIGEIPQDWNVSRIKGLFVEINERCEDSTGYSLLSVSEYYGVAPRADKIADDEILTHAESLDGYKVCKPNDIVMNIMLAWKRALGVSKYEGIVSPAYCVYRPRIDMCVEYFHYLFRTDLYANVFKQYSTGIIDSRLRLYPDKFFALKCQVPPVKTQYRIAGFLDRKCAEIDAVIERTKATIEEYKKLKQAVITEAVTKGVRGVRKMKDSGIEWIGEIPEEWEVCCLKRFCTFKTGTTPSTANADWFDGDVDWFTPSDFGDNYVLTQSKRTLSQQAKNDGVATMIPSDTVLIVGIGATAGKIGLTLCDCSCNQQITAMIAPEMVSRYLMYWMIANTTFLRDTALYTTLPILNNETIGEYLLVAPDSKLEQQEIVEYLDKKCAALDTLIAKKTALLTELETYKKSLIYEYVTGKKEVG